MRAFVIACEMLKDRIYRQASEWQGSGLILLLEGGEGSLESFRGRGREVRFLDFPTFRGLAPSLDSFLAIELLEMELHRDPKLLKSRVLASAGRAAPYTDALLLAYGRCGNPFKSEEEARARLGIPVIFPMEGQELADNCVAMVMGVRRYRESLKENPGTFYMTPEWAAGWGVFFQRGGGGQGLRDAGRMREYLKRCGISRVLKIDSASSDRGAFEAGVRDFAETFGLRVEETQGDDRILEEAFHRLAQL